MARGYFFDDDDPVPDNDPAPQPVRRSGEVYFSGKRLFLPPFGPFDFADFRNDIVRLQLVPSRTLRVDVADGFRYQVWGLRFGPLGDITGYNLPELVISPIERWNAPDAGWVDEDGAILTRTPVRKGGGATTNDLSAAVAAAYEPTIKDLLENKNALLQFLETEDPPKNIDDNGYVIAVGTNDAGGVVPVKIPRRELSSRIRISAEQLQAAKNTQPSARDWAKRMLAAEELELAKGRARAQSGLAATVDNGTVGTWLGIERSTVPMFTSKVPAQLSNDEFKAIEDELAKVDPRLYEKIKAMRERAGAAAAEPTFEAGELVIPTAEETALIANRGRAAGERLRATLTGIKPPPGY